MPHDDVIARLRHALNTGDDLALMVLLDSSVRMLVDTGDDSGGVMRGRPACTARLRAIREAHDSATFVEVSVNGAAGLALREHDGRDAAVLAIGSSANGEVDRLWLSASPHKLLFWNRQRFPDA